MSFSEEPKADWPHSPPHRFVGKGVYMLTAATLLHQHHFRSIERLNFLQKALLETLKNAKWKTLAWAVFSNHYHFIGECTSESLSFKEVCSTVHHKIVEQAEDYPWCSARWFAANASKSWVKTVESYKIDAINEIDDFYQEKGDWNQSEELKGLLDSSTVFAG